MHVVGDRSIESNGSIGSNKSNWSNGSIGSNESNTSNGSIDCGAGWR